MKLFLLLTFLSLSVINLFSQDEIDEYDYALKGVKKIHLIVTISPTFYPALGLTDSEAYGNISYLLRKDGVEVFSNEQLNTPTLSINFMVYEKSKNNCDLHIMMELRQDVTISSNKVKIKASTWARVFDVRNMNNKYQIQETLEQICKVFVNTLLAINPKK